MPTIAALRRPAAVLILISATAVVVATAGGGFTSGMQAPVPSFSNHDLAAAAYGGLGLFLLDQVDDKRLVGGIDAEGLPGSGGYFALYEELDLTVGFAVLPWMQITGYRIVVSILPDFFANEAGSMTPTTRLRLVWGSYWSQP